MKTSFILLLFVFIGCTNNPNIERKETVVPVSKDTVTNAIVLDSLDENIWFPIADNPFDTTIFKEITATEFNFISLNYPTAVIDSSKVEFSDSSFNVLTSKAQLEFPIFNAEHVNRPYDYSYYHGYIENLNLYVLSHWNSATILIGQLQLIDSTTNKGYTLGSVNDGAAEFPIISEDNNLLLFYSNSYHSSGIGILKRIKNGENYSYTQICSFTIRKLIDNLYLLDNNLLALKIKDSKEATELYYLTKLPVDEIDWDHSNIH